MANPFYVEPANPLQALMLGQQGFDRAQKAGQEADMRAGRMEAAQALQNGGDIRSPLARLLQIGDVQGATAIANYAQQQASQQHQAAALAESSRHNKALEGNSAATRSLAERQFQLQQETANRADVKTIKDANGNETLVRVDRNGNASPLNTGIPSTPTNPYAGGAKFTEVQGKAATFADRMANSHGIINENEGINKGFTGAMGGVAANSSLPIVGGDSALFNSMSSDNRQKTVQAQRDFVNAILRRESGAAISAGEFENAKRQYFPQPGDSDAVIAQKRQNRVLAIEGNMREAGPGYKPPTGWGGKTEKPATGITKAQYDALPPGTPYTAPDGSQRIKQ